MNEIAPGRPDSALAAPSPAAAPLRPPGYLRPGLSPGLSARPSQQILFPGVIDAPLYPLPLPVHVSVQVQLQALMERQQYSSLPTQLDVLLWQLHMHVQSQWLQSQLDQLQQPQPQPQQAQPPHHPVPAAVTPPAPVSLQPLSPGFDVLGHAGVRDLAPVQEPGSSQSLDKILDFLDGKAPDHAGVKRKRE